MNTSDIDLDDVRERSDLSPAEKELTVGFTKDDDEADVWSTIGSINRRLISHDHVTIEDLTWSDGQITGVRATVPVGLVLLKGQPRTEDTPAPVVSV